MENKFKNLFFVALLSTIKWTVYMLISEYNYLQSAVVKICFFLGLLFYGSISFAQTTKVEEFLKELDPRQPDSVQIAVLRRLSVAYSSVDPTKKYYYANQYRLLAEKNNIDSTISDGYQDMGIAHAMQSHTDSALYYFKLAQEKARAINYTRGLARSYVNFGFTFDRLDRKKEALKNYTEALAMFKQIGLKSGINQTVRNLASLYFDLHQYRTAQVYFQQVYESLKENPKDELGLANVIFSLASCSRKLGDSGDAMEKYQASLTIRERIGDLTGIALSNWGIAQLYVDKKQYEKALPYLDVSLDNNRALKNVYHESSVLRTLGEAQLGMGNLQQAKETAELLMKNAKAIDSKAAQAMALELLTKVNVAQRNFEAALQNKSDFIAINDSLKVAETVNEVVVSDLNRVNLDNRILERDNKSVTEKNTIYIFVISIITILLLLCVLLLVLYYKRNTEKNNINILLKKQTLLTAETNEELSSINEELTMQMDIVSAQNIELDKLNNVKNKFFSIVSHDLRGPINTLKMLFEFYRSGDLTDTELNDMLAKLEGTIYNTATFLDNLLEWSRSQLAGMVLNPTEFNIKQLIDANISLIDSQINVKSLVVKNDVDSELTFYADREMINTVLRNLLANAVKFCSDGDQIIFNAVANEQGVICSISDNGPGIDTADRENLFNLTHTVSMGTSGEKGYSLGLVLCKDMISQNNGDIFVESELGQGATFSIFIPHRNN